MQKLLISVGQGHGVGGLRGVGGHGGYLKISKTILHVCGTSFVGSRDPQKLI